MLRHRALLLLVIGGFALGACAPDPEAADPPNRHVFANLHVDGTRRSVDDAVAITRDYLADMRREIAAPELHVIASVNQAWAVPANEAWTLDSCIPKLEELFTVWVTHGDGDYLNLRDFTWSSRDGQLDTDAERACREASRSGTIVIDDLTGQILGVFPGDR